MERLKRLGLWLLFPLLLWFGCDSQPDRRCTPSVVIVTYSSGMANCNPGTFVSEVRQNPSISGTYLVTCQCRDEPPVPASNGHVEVKKQRPDGGWERTGW